MALSVKQGNFQAVTSGTTQAITGLGFQPKAVIFFAVSATAETSTGLSSNCFSYGFSDGTNHFAVGWVGASAVSTSVVVHSMQNAEFISLFSSGSASLADATGLSLDSDGFTITWFATPLGAYEIYYIAFGGSDITVKVGNDTMKTTTGTKATTGLGFTPSILFLASSSLTVNGPVGDGQFSMGCAKSTSKRWAIASAVANAATMSANVNGVSIQQSTQCLTGLTSGAAVEYGADLSSMDASGFTLNYATAPVSAYVFGYLAISGGQWDCGTSVAPGSATTQSVSGMAFQPTGLLLAMTGLITLNSITSNAIEAVGLATSTSSRSEIGIRHNDAINTVELVINETIKVIRDPNTTANVADFTSFNSGGWTITWSADTVAYQVAWVAMTSNAAAAVTTAIDGDDYSQKFSDWASFTHDVMKTEYQAVLPPRPPDTYDPTLELSKWDGTWRVLQHDDLLESQSERTSLLAPTTYDPTLELSKFDAGWRVPQHTDLDESQSERTSLLAPTTYDPTLELSKFDATWRALQLVDEESVIDTDLIPPRNARTIEGNEIEKFDATWRAFPFVDEESDKSVSAVAVTPTLAEDGLEQKNFDWRSLPVDKADLDEPGFIGRPDSEAFQDDETPRYVGWWVPQYDELDTASLIDTDLIAAKAIEGDETQKFDASWRATHGVDEIAEAIGAMTPFPSVPSVIGSYTATDDFSNYINEALNGQDGIPWVAAFIAILPIRVISGGAATGLGGVAAGSYSSLRAGPPPLPQFSQATVVALPANTKDWWVTCIAMPNGTCYAGGILGGVSAGQYEIVRYDSATVFNTLVSTASPVPTIGDVVRLDVSVSGTLTLTVNGSVILTTTDFTYSVGWPGLRFDAAANTAYADSWSGSAALTVDAQLGLTDSDAGDMWRDWRVLQQDDLDSANAQDVDFLAPTVFQEEPIERYVGWQALQYYDLDEAQFKDVGTLPAPAIQDEVSERNVDWRAFQLVDEEQDEHTDFLAPTTFQEEPIEKQVDWTARQPEDDSYNTKDSNLLAPTVFQEEPIEKNVDWFARQYEDTDTANAENNYFLAAQAPQEEFTERFVGWTVVYDHTQDTDEPGLLAIPPYSDQGRFALAPEAIILANLTDWSFPLPPTATDESEMYKPIFVPFNLPQEDLDNPFVATPPTATDESEHSQPIFVPVAGTQPDLDNPFVVTPPPVVTNAGIDDLEATYKPADRNVIYDPTSEEPGQFGTPPYADQGRFGLAPQESSLQWFSDWSLPLPPTTDELEHYQPILIPFGWTQKDLDNPFIVTPPVVVTNAGVDDIEAMYKPFDVFRQQQDDELGFAPNPPTANDDGLTERPADWRANQYEDTDTPSLLLPSVPVSQQEEFLESKNVDWAARQPEDDTLSAAQPTPPVTQQEEFSEQKVTDWKALQPDDESYRALPPTPFSVQEEHTEQKSVDWAARQPDDESLLVVPPAPPFSIQEEPIEKYAGWLALRYDDLEEAQFEKADQLAPTASDDEATQKFVGLTTPAIEDDLSSTAPAPPTSFQEEPIEKFVGWTQTFQTDEETQRELPPTPPEVEPETADDFEAQASITPYWTSKEHEDLETGTAPTPPTVFQEEPIEKYVGWQQIFQTDEETQRLDAPTPPTANDDGLTEKSVDWRAIQPEDETFNAQDADTLAPTTQQFEEAEQKNVSWQALHEDGVESGTVPPTPNFVVQEGRDDQETMARMSDPRFIYLEEENRFSTPTPPTVQQTEEAEQKNVDYLARQPEDDTANLKDADLLAPTVFQEEPIEKYAGWTQIFQTDEETQQEFPPIPPEPEAETADDFEPQTQIINWRSGDQVVDDALAPTPPTTFQEEPIERYVGWQQVFQTDEETQQDNAPTPPIANDDGLTEKSVDWRAVQHEDTDTISAAAPTPPTSIQEEPIEKNVDVRQIFHADEETQAALPPTPPEVEPETADDFEALPQISGMWQAFQEYYDAFAPTPPLTPQEEFAEQRFIDWRALQPEDETLTNAAPTPPSAIQEDQIEKYAGWLAIQHEDTETQNVATPAPPTTFQEEPIEKQVDWLARQPEDDSYNAERPDAFAPTANDADQPGATPVPTLVDEALAAEQTPPVPPFVVTEGRDDQESMSRTIDRQFVYTEEENRFSAPTPPVTQQFEESEQKNVDWQVKQQEDTETQRVSTPTPPTTQVPDDLSKFDATWRVPRHDDLDESQNKDTDLLAPTTQQFEEAEQKNVDYFARQYEDTETTIGPAPVPPTVEPEETSEQKNVDWRAFHENKPDEDEPGQLSPPPITQQFEEAEQKNVDWQVKQQEDTETQRSSAPTPPVVQQFEESEQKNIDWKALHEDGVESGKTPPPPPPSVNQGFDDLELSVHAQDTILQYHEDDARALPPTPPDTIQEEPIEKYAGWLAIQHEDTETQSAPAPTPPTVFQEEPIEKNVDVRQVFHADEETQRPDAPTPPVGQADIFIEQWVDWRQNIVEDDASFGAPRPPFALQDQADDNMWRGVSTPAIEDDWSTSAPRPPFALQDQADDSLWRGIQTPIVEDDLSTRAPTPPFAIQDFEETLWRGWSMPLVEDDWLMGTPAPPTAQQDEVSERPLPLTVQFDEVLAAEKTPPPPVSQTTAADDIEAHFRVNVPSLQAEDDTRALPPTPPNVIQFEESEQKNIDYVARQYEDTETQRGSAPTPPTVQQIEETEQKNVDYLARQYEDTETQQAAAPPPPVTQIDEISERYVDWVQPWHEDVEMQRALPPTPPTADDFDHSQMLLYVPMPIQFDEADAREFPPPPPPTHIGAGRDDEDLQMYREYAGPYYESVNEQWVWFSGFIYPLSVIGSGFVQAAKGLASLSITGGIGQATPGTGTGQVTPTEGTGEIDPIIGEGEKNADID